MILIDKLLNFCLHFMRQTQTEQKINAFAKANNVPLKSDDYLILRNMILGLEETERQTILSGDVSSGQNFMSQFAAEVEKRNQIAVDHFLSIESIARSTEMPSIVTDRATPKTPSEKESKDIREQRERGMLEW